MQNTIDTLLPLVAVVLALVDICLLKYTRPNIIVIKRIIYTLWYHSVTKIGWYLILWYKYTTSILLNTNLHVTYIAKLLTTVANLASDIALY